MGGYDGSYLAHKHHRPAGGFEQVPPKWGYLASGWVGGYDGSYLAHKHHRPAGGSSPSTPRVGVLGRSRRCGGVKRGGRAKLVFRLNPFQKKFFDTKGGKHQNKDSVAVLIFARSPQDKDSWVRALLWVGGAALAAASISLSGLAEG